MLQTLGKRCVGVIVCGGLFGWCVGFEVSLDHPHSHVVKGTQLMNCELCVLMSRVWL